MTQRRDVGVRRLRSRVLRLFGFTVVHLHPFLLVIAAAALDEAHHRSLALDDQ